MEFHGCNAFAGDEYYSGIFGLIDGILEDPILTYHIFVDGLWISDYSGESLDVF